MCMFGSILQQALHLVLELNFCLGDAVSVSRGRMLGRHEARHEARLQSAGSVAADCVLFFCSMRCLTLKVQSPMTKKRSPLPELQSQTENQAAGADDSASCTLYIIASKMAEDCVQDFFLLQALYGIKPYRVTSKLTD